MPEDDADAIQKLEDAPSPGYLSEVLSGRTDPVKIRDVAKDAIHLYGLALRARDWWEEQTKHVASDYEGARQDLQDAMDDAVTIAERHDDPDVIHSELRTLRDERAPD